MKNTANVRPFVTLFLGLMCLGMLGLTVCLPHKQQEKYHRTGGVVSTSNTVSAPEAATPSGADVEEVTFSVKPKLGSK